MNQDCEKHPGLLLVISGPSGVGKTTITHHVEKELDGQFSVSVTTRPKTAADVEGVDYEFIDEPEFLRRRDAGEFLEWAQVFDHYYATPKAPVEQAIKQGRLFIMEIDVEGAIKVKQALPEAFFVFVLPRTEDVLLQRLRQRQREDESIILKRFAKAKSEIHQAYNCATYDVFLVNDHLEDAVTRAVGIVRAEMQWRKTQAERHVPASQADAS